MRAAVAGVLLIGLSLPVLMGGEPSGSGADDRREATYLMQSVSYPEMDLVRYLGPVLLRGHQAGRVYYRAACSTVLKHEVAFPRLAVVRQPNDAVGLTAARAIFRNPQDASVTIDGAIIKIRIGSVPDDILKVRIPRLTFDQYAQYNVIDAINAIMNSREASATSDRVGIRWPPTVIDHLVQEPMEGYPHMPAVLTDLTVDQALDKVATTFNLIVFYGINSCSSDAAFYVNYARIEPEMWKPDVWSIVQWLKIPPPTSWAHDEDACAEVDDSYNCEFDILDVDTDKPVRHVKVRAVWTADGWKYSSPP